MQKYFQKSMHCDLYLWTLKSRRHIISSTHGESVCGEQRTLTSLDTWSCPTMELASALMLIQISPQSPELVLFTDFLVSNIPRYICFAFIMIGGKVKQLCNINCFQ